MALNTLDKPTNGLSNVNRGVKRFGQVVEFGDAVEKAAENCRKNTGYIDCFEKQRSFYEVVIDQGLRVLEKIDAEDIAYRNRLFAGEAGVELDAEIQQTYKQWLNTARHVIDLVDRLEHYEVEVEGSDDLRTAIDDVEDILTPDEEFFEGETLVELRDAALDAHGNNQSEPLCK